MCGQIRAEHPRNEMLIGSGVEHGCNLAVQRQTPAGPEIQPVPQRGAGKALACAPEDGVALDQARDDRQDRNNQDHAKPAGPPCLRRRPNLTYPGHFRIIPCFPDLKAFL
jgi:hypothetical protein